jgi:uncharacterized damage-inducible protein DinB
MPGQVDPVVDERDGLMKFLAQQRYYVKLSAHGLTDEQARATPTDSSLSVGGLLKHLALVETNWIDTVLRIRSDEDGYARYAGSFTMGDDETLESLIEAYDQVAERTEQVIAGVADLDQPVPVPDEPWFRKDVDAWSVRWVLLHLITETARHAGHADLVREHVDGATAIPLMAGAEGWPETPWVKPWKAAEQ